MTRDEGIMSELVFVCIEHACWEVFLAFRDTPSRALHFDAIECRWRSFRVEFR